MPSIHQDTLIMTPDQLKDLGEKLISLSTAPPDSWFTTTIHTVPPSTCDEFKITWLSKKPEEEKPDDQVKEIKEMRVSSMWIVHQPLSQILKLLEKEF